MSSFDSVFKAPIKCCPRCGRVISRHIYSKSVSDKYCPHCGRTLPRHIYSAKSPRKYPDEVGKLCKKVFEDDWQNPR